MGTVAYLTVSAFWSAAPAPGCQPDAAEPRTAACPGNDRPRPRWVGRSLYGHRHTEPSRCWCGFLVSLPHWSRPDGDVTTQRTDVRLFAPSGGSSAARAPQKRVWRRDGCWRWGGEPGGVSKPGPCVRWGERLVDCVPCPRSYWRWRRWAHCSVFCARPSGGDARPRIHWRWSPWRGSTRA